MPSAAEPLPANRLRGPSPVKLAPTLRSVRPEGGLLTHTRLLLIALAGVTAFGRFSSPTFFSTANLRNIMLNVSILGMLALGMTLVMLLREIDLSVGSMMAFAPIVAIDLTALIYRGSETQIIRGGNVVVGGTAIIIALTLLLSVIVGLANGLLTVKGAVPSVIVTLGALFALRGGSFVVSGGNQFFLTELDNFMWLGSATVFGFVPMSFMIFLVFGVVGIVSLRFTKIGRRIYAIGGNEKAAVYTGINAGRWKIGAFVFSGLCAGVAALFLSSRLGSAEAAQASGFELSAVAIAVVGGATLQGGRGTFLNTILASLLLAIVMNIIALRGLVSWYQTVILGLIIVSAGFAYTMKNRQTSES